MDDMNDRIKERWEQRRKKGNNWPRLIIMTLILVALLVTMARMNQCSQAVTPSQAEFIDSTATVPDSTGRTPQ